MDIQEEWSQACICRKIFYQPNSYSNHINSCKIYRSQVGSALEGGKARFQARRARQKRGNEALNSWYGEDDLDVDLAISPVSGVGLPVATTSNPTSPLADLSIQPSGGLLDQVSHIAPPPAVVVQDQAIIQLGTELGPRIPRPTPKYRDFEMTSPYPFNIPHYIPPDSPSSESEETLHRRLDKTPAEQRLTILDDDGWRETLKNEFHLYKRYWTLEDSPHDPDYYYVLDQDLHDAASERTPSPGSIYRSSLAEDNPDTSVTEAQVETGASLPGEKDALYPFPNLSSFRLGEWFWDDRLEKSQNSFSKLIDIISDEDFSPQEVRLANWKKINAVLGGSVDDDGEGGNLWEGDGSSWRTTSVTITIPFNSTSLSPGSAPYSVPGFRFRPLVPVLLEKLRSAGQDQLFHVVPSDLRWQPRPAEDVRVYGEMYHSPAFLEAYREVQQLPPEETDDKLPRYVLGLSFASDETTLSVIGNTKAWPLYLAFGNDSKQRRGKPSLQLFEEVAYFQEIPDQFAEWYTEKTGKKNVSKVLSSHLKREFFHAQWKALLDDDFVHAYKHGLVAKGFDGETRRFYPRILTYSADYPEKTLLVGVRKIGDFPCFRCLVPVTELDRLGTVADRTLRSEKRSDLLRVKNVAKARRLIFKKPFYAVNTKLVEDLLKPYSIVPSQNAFSDRLSAAGLEVYSLPAIDILHEFELGPWRDLFIHLLRVLNVVGTADSLHVILNSRFRQTPTFGKDTIRRFRRNVSDLKQMAARDYEDILQCCLPVFEGLFPGEHDARIQDLLFIMAHWHSLAKLRMHTDYTLDLLDSWTMILGDASRDFVATTCAAIKTCELKKEYEARKRRQAKAEAKTGKESGKPEGRGEAGSTVAPLANAPSDSRRLKTWNIQTPKFHSLGDVVGYIRQFGTTDSYSTQQSERFHRFSKARYRRTNKKNVVHQLSVIQARQARIRKMRKRLASAPEDSPDSTNIDLSAPYFVGKTQNSPVRLSHFLRVNADDLATKGFIHKLKRHLVPRVLAKLLEEARTSPDSYSTSVIAALEDLSKSSSDATADHLYFHSESIYRHHILQIHYNTYDCRRGVDILSPGTSRRDFMCMAAQNADGFQLDQNQFPGFVYGRLLGVFHVNVIYLGPGMLDHRKRRFDFMWVRWFVDAPGQQGGNGWSAKRLDRLSLAPLTHQDACSFLDPSDVIRGAHLIPRYALGSIHQPDGPGRISSKFAQNHRDMVMRFHWGLAVGHAYGTRTDEQDPTSRMDVDQIVDADDHPNQGSAGSDSVDLEVWKTDSEDSAYDAGENSESTFDSDTDGFRSDGSRESESSYGAGSDIYT
ncbi:hypothetical protein DFP72DRAFT_1066293 [Ephemerocybe angulata]|uniref:Uncharacterized protein n=1 Tax=Ephemerocybe angulata TaxID=980116 RepID=A0A8H6I0Z0_9AGAR|nr:hypothetical protein DFP72DRAFT_1066293 [Tulosesus angulatus]